MPSQFCRGAGNDQVISRTIVVRSLLSRDSRSSGVGVTSVTISVHEIDRATFFGGKQLFDDFPATQHESL